MRIKSILLFIACCITACTPIKSNTSEGVYSDDKQSARPFAKLSPILPDNDGKTIDTINIDKINKTALITANWLVHFPLPDNTWGYSFEKSGRFDYVNNSDGALKRRYWFTSGNWRLNGNEIQVQITSYTKADRDPITDAIGFRFPNDTQYIKVPIADETWYTIGNLSDIIENQVKDGVEIPMHLPLRTILFDQVLDDKVVHIRYSSQ